MLDTIAVRAPFGAKKGLTVKGKTTESEIVFTSLEKSIPSRNFAGTLVFLLLLTGLIVSLSFFVLGGLLFLDFVSLEGSAAS